MAEEVVAIITGSPILKREDFHRKHLRLHLECLELRDYMFLCFFVHSQTSKANFGSC